MKKRRDSDRVRQKIALHAWIRRSSERCVKAKPIRVNSKKSRIPKGRTIAAFPKDLDIFEHPNEWARLFSVIAHPKKRHITLDMRKIEFAYPEAVVYLAALVDVVFKKTNASVSEEHPRSEKVHEYFFVCGLRKFFGVRPKSDARSEPKFFGDCIPITRDAAEASSTSFKVAALIASRLDLSNDMQTFLGDAIGEIMGNSIEHSEVRQWYRVCQVHPTRAAITIAIADNGIGVPTTLRRGFNGQVYRSLPDHRILAASFNSDVTRHPPAFGDSHGIGLSTVWEFAKATGSKLAMVSGRGWFTVNFQGNQEVYRQADLDTSLPGTLLVLRIPFTYA